MKVLAKEMMFQPPDIAERLLQKLSRNTLLVVSLKKIRRLGFLSGSLLCLLSLLGAAPAAATRVEIQHLLIYLENSECQFYRNGSWHSAAAARTHLDKKYQYFLNKGLIKTAEDFIERAAAESSTTGKPYQVKCGASAPVTSAQWLSEELNRYRAKQAKLVAGYLNG
ncbi:MAG: DUF5329 domain-containing protein [Candidatus Binatia bacterium]